MTTENPVMLKQPSNSTAVETIFPTFEEAKAHLLKTVKKHTNQRHAWGIIMLLRDGTYLCHWRPSEPCFGGLRKYKSEDNLRPADGEFKATRDEKKPTDIPSVFPLGTPVYLITINHGIVGKERVDNFIKVFPLWTSTEGPRKKLFEVCKPHPIIINENDETKIMVRGLEWDNLSVLPTLLVEFLMVFRGIGGYLQTQVKTYDHFATTKSEKFLSIAIPVVTGEGPYSFINFSGGFYGAYVVPPDISNIINGTPKIDEKEKLFNEGGDYQRKNNESFWVPFEYRSQTPISYKEALAKVEKLLSLI